MSAISFLIEQNPFHKVLNLTQIVLNQIQRDFFHFRSATANEQSFQHHGLIHVTHFHLLLQVLFYGNKSHDRIVRLNPPKPIPSFLIVGENVAALHPAGHQGAIGVFDDQIQFRSGPKRFLLHQFLPAKNALVRTRPFAWVRDHLAIANQ